MHLRIILATMLVASMAATVNAQSVGESKFEPGFGRAGIAMAAQLLGSLANNDSAKILLRTEIQDELELSDSQIQSIRDLGQTTRPDQLIKAIGLDFSSLKDASPTEVRTELENAKKKAKTLHKESTQKLRNVLSNRQFRRLEQIRFQNAIMEGNVTGALQGAGIALNEGEIDELQEAMQEAHGKFASEASKLRMDLFLDAMSSVVRRQKLQSLRGNEFDFGRSSNRMKGHVLLSKKLAAQKSSTPPNPKRDTDTAGETSGPQHPRRLR